MTSKEVIEKLKRQLKYEDGMPRAVSVYGFPLDDFNEEELRVIATWAVTKYLNEISTV